MTDDDCELLARIRAFRWRGTSLLRWLAAIARRQALAYLTRGFRAARRTRSSNTRRRLRAAQRDGAEAAIKTATPSWSPVVNTGSPAIALSRLT